MAKNKVTRIIRPHSKKAEKEKIPSASLKDKAEEGGKVGEGKLGERADFGGGGKENHWSDWTWSDERRLYYRARKDFKAGEGIWQYEYTAESHPTITPIAAHKEVPQQYVRTSIEYPAQQPKVLYEAYTYELSSSGKGLYKVPVCSEISTGVNPVGEATAQKDGGEKTNPGKERGETVKAAPEKDKRGKESKVRVERVDEWVQHVNDAIQEGEEEESGDSKVGKDGKVKKHEKHPKKRDGRHKEHKERK